MSAGTWKARLSALLGTVMVMVLVSLSIALTGAPASAAAYAYHVGHPMFWDYPGNPEDYCTGGYAVRGTSGTFVVTAGHCRNTGTRVYGTREGYGTIIRNDFSFTSNSFDAALVRLDPDDIAYQIVVDPIGGGRPGDGRVRGWYANSALTEGFVVGMMGRTTGWYEGRITGWQHLQFGGGITHYLLCTTIKARSGDSGGPVWRLDQNGVMAIGIVSATKFNGDMCFNPIENVLLRFGAWLPVFTSPNAGTDQVRAATVVTEPDGPPLQVDHTPVPAVLL